MRAFAPYPLASFLLAAALLAPTAPHGDTAPAPKAASAAAKECRAVARYNTLSAFATKAFISDCLAAAKATAHPPPKPGRPLTAARPGRRLASGT